MARKLRIGINVKIITGKYRKHEGQIKKIDGDYIIVSGVPGLKKTVKADPRTQTEGGFKTVERKIHSSNVVVLEGAKDE